LSGERIENFAAHPVDIASAKRRDYVALARAERNSRGGIFVGAKIMNLEMTARTQRFVEPARRNIGDGFLARGINLDQIENVGVVESRQEFVEEIAEPGVAMRLEDGDRAALERSAHCRQRRADLGRMMRIVVEHDASCRLALDLE